MSEDTGTTGATGGNGTSAASGRAATASAGDLHQGADVPLAVEVAAEVQAFLDTVTHVAAGDGEGAAIPLLHLALSRVLAVGARLGATQDVVPSERFEPDAGPEVDMDPLRLSLVAAMGGSDGYTETVDPQGSTDVAWGSVADDVTGVASDLAHGLRHLESGRVAEALWWWQYAYLATWGQRGTAAQRALVSLMAHARLDVDADVAAEAEFEALHAR